MSQWFPLYFPVILVCLTRVVWTVKSPQNSLLSEKRKERSVHNAVKCTLVVKPNTAAPILIIFYYYSVIIRWELDRILPPPPSPPRCTFLRLIKNIIFCHPGVCFFEKLQRSETFGKLQLTSAIVWTHYDFPLVFHAANTITQCVVESPPLY